MKESVLAKLYVQILGISPESDDGKRLIHWRRPNGGTSSSSLAPLSMASSLQPSCNPPRLAPHRHPGRTDRGGGRLRHGCLRVLEEEVRSTL
jgi:hypothetical protein